MELRKFLSVDVAFKRQMKATAQRPAALRACTAKGLGKSCKDWNMTLDSIQRALEEYLDRKRFSFPRFYFLSNEEMFDMLSNLRDINAVQPLLKKCFAGLYKLIFGGQQGYDGIVSM